jgi:hypothetical protein
VTVRAFVIGCVCALLLGIGIPYCDLVMKGTWVGLTAFPISSFFLLFLLTAGVNVLLRKVKRGFSHGELLLIYCMMLVAAGIPSFGLTGLLIPYIAGPFYFATPENRWAETIQPHIPKWLAPQKREAIVWLYDGLPSGKEIPWDEWVTPLIAWSALVLGVYLVFFCLSAILRKPWVDHEKLVFPLVHLPIDMARYEDGSALPSFFRNRVTWLFFALPFAIHTINGLHYYMPVIPTFNVHLISLDSYFSQRPWSAATPFWLRFSFTMIGLAYLLPLELSFSLWFFYFFFLAQQVIADHLGVPLTNVQAYPVKSFVGHQMIGGILVYAVYGLWGAREHLREVVRKALGFRVQGSGFGEDATRNTQHATRNPSDDANEPLSFRFALFGVIIGLLFISTWGYLTDAGFIATLIIFVLFFLVHIIAVRLVCEGGMLYVQHPFRPVNIMLAALGTSGLGISRIPMFVYFDHLFMLDNRSPLMPSLMQSLRIGDAASLNRRRLFGALAISVLIAMLSSYWSYLRLMYRHGGLSLNLWFTSYYTRNLYSTWTNQLVTNGEPAAPLTLFTMLIGGGTMLGLLFMHRNFLWFPLHPIGYLMGASWPMINFWFPVFIAWMIKGLVLRYGGAKLYRRLLPGFLGFILAEFLSAGLWAVIDFCAGVKGHEIFSF